MICPRCCSDDLVSISGDYWSGVEMNGYREMLHEDGYQCQRCGLKMHDDDVLDEMPQWSITPSGEVFYIA